MKKQAICFIIFNIIFIILANIPLYFIHFILADSPSGSSIASSNVGSTIIHYSINPVHGLDIQQKETYSILTIKFTDINNNIINDITKYTIIIKNSANDVILERSDHK